MYEIIEKKRDGKALTTEEINWFISGYTKGDIPDYQAAALCMAIYLRGMDIRETTDLTLAVRDSGDKLDFSSVDGIRVDKHSTGGVGDKTSLIITPIVASLGIKVAKMSGRGLGHTGGTVDKLESIPGFRTELSTDEFLGIVNKVGVAIVGQSLDFAPADKKLNALRDVTATVSSIPLIASSIMGKKLAADDDCILLDVKTGSGAFMKTLDDSRELAKTLVEIGKRAGKKMMAMITDMDRPLGYAIGNSLEVIEAIDVLRGKGPKDLTDVCVDLASNMLVLAGKGTREESRNMVLTAISDGSALRKFAEMVDAQGGRADMIMNPDLFPRASIVKAVTAEKDGYIERVDTEGYGIASLMLGAGRNTKDDVIDHSAGLMLNKKTGDRVKAGDVIAYLHTNNASAVEVAEKKLLDSTVIGKAKPKERPLVFDIVE